MKIFIQKILIVALAISAITPIIAAPSASKSVQTKNSQPLRNISKPTKTTTNNVAKTEPKEEATGWSFKRKVLTGLGITATATALIAFFAYARNRAQLHRYETLDEW